MESNQRQQPSACIKRFRFLKSVSQAKLAEKVGIRQDPPVPASSSILSPQTGNPVQDPRSALTELPVDIKPCNESSESPGIGLKGGVVMANLAVYMNGYRVGTFTKTTSGAHQFQYHESWLAQPGSRPISLSMPLRHQAYRGMKPITSSTTLPDITEGEKQGCSTLSKRHQPSPSICSVALARDSVGHYSWLPGHDVPDVRQIDYKALSDDEIERILTSYKSKESLGMVREQESSDLYRRGARKDCAALYRWPLVLATQSNADNPHYQTPYRQD